MEENHTNSGYSQIRGDQEEQPAPKDRDLDAEYEVTRQSVEKFEIIFNSIPDGVIVTGKDGRPIFYNSSAKGILTVEPGQVDPDLWAEKYGLFLEDQKTYFPCKSLPLQRALTGEENPSEEILLHPKQSESYTWILMSAHPMRDQDGEITGAIVILRDVSYHKKLEISRQEHAQRAEMLYSISRSIAEIGDDLNQILSTVAKQTSTFIGDSCVITLFEYGTKKLKIIATYHPNPKTRSLLKEVLTSDEYDLEEGIIGGVIKSGEPLLFPFISEDRMATIIQPEYGKYVREVGIQSLLIVPIKGRDGILGSLGVTRDRDGISYTAEDQSSLLEIAHRTGLAIDHSSLINSLRHEIADRLSAEKALIESEKRFSTIFETTFLGVKILDTEGRIVQTNRAFQEMIGRSEGQIIGRHFSDFLYINDQAKSRIVFKKLAGGDYKKLSLEHRLIHADGSTVWLNASFSTVGQVNGGKTPDFIFGIVENITDRKVMELEMIEMKSRLQESIERERLRLAQDLHDGPMQVLYSTIFQIERMRDNNGIAQSESLHNLRQDIQKVIENLRETTQELRPPTLGDFGLEKAIRSHTENISEKYQQPKFFLSLAQDRQYLPENIRLALFRIYQASVSNILRHAEASEVHVQFTYDVEEARLEIRDNGKGFVVPARWLEFTRQEHFGLAGAAERANSLGGSFIVESEPGKGTTVRTVISHLNVV